MKFHKIIPSASVPSLALQVLPGSQYLNTLNASYFRNSFLYLCILLLYHKIQRAQINELVCVCVCYDIYVFVCVCECVHVRRAKVNTECLVCFIHLFTFVFALLCILIEPLIELGT